MQKTAVPRGLAGDERCEVWAVDPERVQAARARLLDDEVYGILAETFGALADSNRAKILHSLLHGELCVCDLASVVGISESAVSQHLRILRALHMVRSRKEGRMVYYSLDDAHVRSLLELGLVHLRDGR